MVFDSIAARVRRARTAEGGYGSVAGGDPEPEPTAMAALALDDRDAVAWLLGAQSPDGSFGTQAGSVFSDDTALVCLSLPRGDQLERALDHVVATTGTNQRGGSGPPPFGWPWTSGAYGWTEPTAWGVLALRAKRPSATERIADGIDTLAQRECAEGGWNYGTPESFGVAEPPFVQTTAVALFATAGIDQGLTRRGLAALRARWRSESAGLLTLATATAAFRRLDDADAGDATDALEHAVVDDSESDTVALAWAALALGPGLQALSVG
jgi:hypothetical protein